MHIKKEDIIQTEQYRHKPDTHDDYSSYVFTIKGEEDYIDDKGRPVVNDRQYIRNGKEFVENASAQPQALAKISRGRINQYYIKAEHNGLFVNPLDIYSNKHVGRVQQQRIDAGRRFIAVKKEAFDLYMKFLQTKLEKYLLQAQRKV